MYKTWYASAEEGEALSRELEAHLNEYADDVISVAYAVKDLHHALAVYKPIEPHSARGQEEAVTVAEQIIDQAQS